MDAVPSKREMRELNFMVETKRGLGYSSALLDSEES
jgi:hypothetical protein